MKITVLGCGTSTGVPLLLCECSVCNSKNPKNNRTRASILIELNNSKNILIDTSSDFRLQALRENIKSIDAIFFTHLHSDHTGGLDDLRPYYFVHSKPINIYGNQETLNEIKRVYSYIFKRDPKYKGGKLPELIPIELENYEKFSLFNHEFQSIPILHSEMEVIGYRIGNFAYITDCSYISEKSLELLNNLEVLIVDGLREKPHPSHFTIFQSVELAEKIKPKQTFLTHMSHDLDYEKTNAKLPKNIELAYDGLQIEIN